MGRINRGGIRGAIQGLDVLRRAPHDVAQGDVLLDLRQAVRGVVVFAEIDVVIDDGARCARLADQGAGLLPRLGIDGEKGAEQHDVARTEIQRRGLESRQRAVPEKLVMGVAPLVQQGQGDGALPRGTDQRLVRDPVLPHEGDDDIRHGVVARLGDHPQGHPGVLPPERAAQGNHGVEGGSARNGGLGLPAPEYDVEDGLPDAGDAHG